MLTRTYQLSWKGCYHGSLCQAFSYHYDDWTITRCKKPVPVKLIYVAKEITFKTVR